MKFHKTRRLHGEELRKQINKNQTNIKNNKYKLVDGKLIYVGRQKDD